MALPGLRRIVHEGQLLMLHTPRCVKCKHWMCFHVGFQQDGRHRLKVFQCQKCAYIFRITFDKE